MLAKSVTESRIKANMTFTKLDSDDMKILFEISQSQPKRYVYPAFGVDFGFPDQS